MTDIQNDYSAIADEIKYYHDLILKESNKDSRIKELYKGCQILFSPLRKPEFLLVGFNPGGGYAKWHGKIVQEFEPMQALEYYLNKHSLGDQTKSLFSLAGKEKDLENSTVKFNFYPWATNNVADFNELMKLLPSGLNAKLFHLSRVWTKRLIDIIDPRVIVCEGFKAFEEVEVLFSDKAKFESNEYIKFFQGSNDINVFGYKRNQGSIVEKDKIANSLNSIVYNSKI